MRLRFESVEEQRAYLAPRLRRLFPRFRTGGHIYVELLRRWIRPGATVLDAGCGSGGLIAEVRPQIGRLIGVDQDAAALARNRLLDQAIQADLSALPLAAESVDLIASEFVLEHLAQPQQVFREWHRVLKHGGRFVFLTSNLLNPVMIASRFLPHSAHARLRHTLLRKAEAAHRTYYRANTNSTLRRLAAAAGFRVAALEHAGNPEYLAFLRASAVPSILFERLLDRKGLRQFQMYLVGVLEKS